MDEEETYNQEYDRGKVRLFFICANELSRINTVSDRRRLRK